MEKTTITISKQTKSRLDALKAHPRQSYEEVINNLLPKLVETSNQRKN